MHWPDGHRAAACFSFDFDVESVWIADDPANAQRPGVLSQGSYGAKVGVQLVLDVLRRHEVAATFFVPGVVAEDHGERVAQIVAEGHELAVHGYTHSSPTTMTRDEERSELMRALAALAPFKAELSGYRAPSWELSDATLELLGEVGLQYSSNMMDDISPYLHPGTSIVELPVHWSLDDAAHWWFCADDWARKIATNQEVREIWREEFLGIVEQGGCCVFTMHPQLVGRPGRIRLLDQLVQDVRAHRDVWIAPCAEVARHVAEAA